MKVIIPSVILMLSVVVTSANLHAGILDDTYVPESYEFDVSEYQPTKREFFSAAIKGLTFNGWKIDHVGYNLVNGKYGHNFFVEVRLVNGTTIILQEIDRDYAANIFSDKWMKNIEKKVLEELQYQYFMKKADSL